MWGYLGKIGDMPRMSSVATEAKSRAEAVIADASTATGLAQRLLEALKPALKFDDAEMLALDGESLLFTRLLAYDGERLPHFAFFLRDVYMVSREPDWLRIDRLLREGGGSAAFHEEYRAWLRASPPAMSQEDFAEFWRGLQSPPGGGLRYGISHRRRWLAFLQLARWGPGPGFTPSDLELLDRLAPKIGAALARLLVRPSQPAGDLPTAPEWGFLLFDSGRRLFAIDEPASAWLRRLPDDGLGRFGVDVPIAVQSVVNVLTASDQPTATNHVADQHGVGVTIRAARASAVSPAGLDRMGPCYSVSIGRSSWNWAHPAIASLPARRQEIAQAVAEGLGDVEIAARLGISPATVHDSVTDLHRAVDTGTRAALVAVLNRA